VRTSLKHFARTLFLLALLAVFTERELRAYTDPGSGILAWQMLLAGFAGAMFYGRKAIRRFFRRRG